MSHEHDNSEELIRLLLRTAMHTRRIWMAPPFEGPHPQPPRNPHPHRHHGPHGPHHSHDRALTAVVSHPGSSQKEIAELLGIQPQSCREALTRLEEQGLVERKRNDRDKRTISVYPTKTGEAKIKSESEARQKLAQDILDPLSEKDRADLERILKKLHER